ncbi:MAG: AraC family transcriptional regulator [Nitrospira sp.]|nr:AraC family transcriptional regulator [Nitrospira sp.]
MERPKRVIAQLDELQALIEQLRPHAPHWADRLSHAATDHEFLGVLCKLFDLSVPAVSTHGTAVSSHDLETKISHFILANLHKGPTLKILAQYLGYSEKYCSELFRAVMKEPFSRYLARRRIEVASQLLTTTDRSIADIAAALGFSDQFSFSHFFKRATGLSPRGFRAGHTRRQSFPATSSPHGTHQ